MRYVSLHHHTTFSYGDGYGTPQSHVERVASLGMSAMAVTEHGNITSHVQFEKAANATGIKPIFGLEAYCAPDDMRETANRRKWHLTILAENQEGYRNLCRLVTKSWADGFYQWPTIHGRWLEEHSEGLIVLSGCLDSKLACDLLGGKGRDFGNEADAVRTLKSFKRIFGDRFYLETQQFPELARAGEINRKYAEWSRKYGIPLVATSDCHYPVPEDSTMQTILHAASRGTGTVAAAEASWEYDIKLTPPTSDKAILKRLMGTGLTRRDAELAIDSTSQIAARCDAKLIKAENLRFPLPRDYKDSGELAWDWLRKGWRYRLARNPAMRANKKVYAERLKYEMEMIQSKDFLDYFLMLSDAVSWGKDAGIAVGPARGSAAASLACYLWRITEIDPIPFPNMLFERFIDVTRTDLPDVDLDFDDERRDELRQHMVDLYGANRVGNVGTFTKYKGKNSLEDVGRVYTVPKYKIDTIKGYVVERSGADARADESLGDTIEMFAEAKKVMDEYPDLYNALRLEGNYKGMSVHAAGLVVSNTPITDNVAYYTREDKKNNSIRQVLSVDKRDAEYMNLLKVDLLGLKTMGQIGRSLELIGMPLDDLYSLPLDLPEVIEAFRVNDVVGIFQYSGLATRIVNGDVKPDSFLELCDVNALSRPGPLHSGTTNDYVDTKWGRKEPTHYHPIIDELTSHTKFQIIYQEQMLQILKIIGDFPWTSVNAIRSVISKKYGDAAFNEKRGEFIEGATRSQGMEEELAGRIWARLVTAGSYAFNNAHCVSYSTLAYWQMWMKVHHPEAFYAGNLIKFKDNEYSLLRDALDHGIAIKPPDLNKSGVTWGIVDGALAGGLSQIRGIGDKVSAQILEDREANGLFEHVTDITRIKGVGPVMAKKITAVTESDDPYEIKKVDRVLAKVRKAIDRRTFFARRPTHSVTQIGKARKGEFIVTLSIPIKRIPQDLVENERGRTGKSEEEVRAAMKDPHLTKYMAMVCMDEGQEQMFARYNRYSFPRFEDAIWNHLNLKKDVCLFWGKRSQAYGNSLNVDGMLILDPDIFDDDGNLIDDDEE